MLAAALLAASIAPVRLRCESLLDPTGLGVAQPRLSWALEGRRNDARQTAFQVHVATTLPGLLAGQPDLWDSGKVRSTESLHHRYRGRPLASSQRAFWRVRVWDEGGRPSDWSQPGTWLTGLLDPSEWTARWIATPEEAGPKLDFDGAKWIWSATDPAMVAAGVERVFRREFALGQTGRASLIAAIDNSGEVWINGNLAAQCDDWSRAEPVDVTGLLRQGNNEIEVRARNGGSAPNEAGVLLRLFVDGQAVVSTDETWETDGGIRTAAPYGDAPWGKVTVGRHGPLPIFRREFAVAKRVRQAVVHVCGLGQFDLFLDGKKVGDHFLDPAWSQFEKTVYATSFDLTDSLKEGRHAFQVMLGKGFYNTVGDRRVHGVHADRPLKLILQAELTYEDGTRETIATDESWSTASGPITHSAILGGEDYDARLAANAAWRPAQLAEAPSGRIVFASSPPLRLHGRLLPVRIDEPEPGRFVYDFGQNAAAVPEIRVCGRAGQAVRLVPAEQRFGGSPRANDGRGLVNQAGVGRPNYFEYTLRGGEAESWRPQFSYSGFQYLQVEGAVPAGHRNPDGLPVVEELVSRPIWADLPRVGSVSTSNGLLNRIEALIDVSVRSNLSHVYTDCPHREKLGWLEVPYLMGPATLSRYDGSAYYPKIALDIADSQRPDGLVETVAPAYPEFAGGFTYTPEWGQAAVEVPWLAYLYYGDVETLAARFEAMRRFVDSMEASSKDLVPVAGLGDWYDYGHGKGSGPARFTPPEVSAMATFHRAARLVAESAKALGRKDDERRYRALVARIRDRFNAEFFDGKSEYQNLGSPQTANAMALVEGMVPPRRRGAVLDRIVADLKERDYQQTSGDIGFVYLLRALAEGGRSDVVMRIADRTTMGSYGFFLEKGWTSLPEAWDADTGASMNHCMLGHLQEWTFGWLAGLRPLRPGWREFAVDPHPVAGVDHAEASIDSPRGRIAAAWRLEGGKRVLEIEVPPGTTAVVSNGGKRVRIGSGRHRFVE